MPRSRVRGRQRPRRRAAILGNGTAAVPARVASDAHRSSRCPSPGAPPPPPCRSWLSERQIAWTARGGDGVPRCLPEEGGQSDDRQRYERAGEEQEGEEGQVQCEARPAMGQQAAIAAEK